MISSLYSGISGLNANTQKMSVVGDNIANVNTTGFKSTEISFDNLINKSAAGYTGMEIGSGVLLSDVSYNWGQGTLERTTNPYDMAISGKGFFIVQTDDGEQFYTRAGEFDFDEEGNLVNPEGYVVQGYAIPAGVDPPADPAAGLVPITIDPEVYQDITVDEDGVYYGVVKDPDAANFGQKVALFQIAVCDVNDKSSMAKMSGNLYTKVTPGLPETFGIPETFGLGAVTPSTLEMSNVDLAKEFVNMIVAQRAFSANSKVITTSDEILQELVNLKR